MADDIPNVYRELKRQDPDRLLIFRAADRTAFALGADAAELRRLVSGKVPHAHEDFDPVDRLVVRPEDLEAVLALIVRAGRHAAVLERVGKKDVRAGETVVRIATEG